VPYMYSWVGDKLGIRGSTNEKFVEIWLKEFGSSGNIGQLGDISL
jgi:hypothetical protein